MDAPGSVSVTIGKLLIAGGILLVAFGIAMYLLGRYGGEWRGLPGDIVLRIGNATIFLPLATSIAISIALSVILSLGWFIVGLLRR
jgi:hypothetical protein